MEGHQRQRGRAVQRPVRRAAVGQRQHRRRQPRGFQRHFDGRVDAGKENRLDQRPSAGGGGPPFSNSYHQRQARAGHADEVISPQSFGPPAAKSGASAAYCLKFSMNRRDKSRAWTSYAAGFFQVLRKEKISGGRSAQHCGTSKPKIGSLTIGALSKLPSRISRMET